MSQTTLPSDAQLEDVLNAEYSRYIHAVKERDAATIMNLLTPDFAWTLVDGQTLDRHQTQTLLHEYLDSFETFESMSITIREIEKMEDGVRVVVEETTSGTMKSLDAATQNVLVEETLRERWIQTEDGWKIVQTEVLASQTTEM